MEAVAFKLHVRCVHAISRVLSARQRLWLERGSLLLAVVLLVILVRLHRLHVVRAPPWGGGGTTSSVEPYMSSNCITKSMLSAGVDPNRVDVLHISVPGVKKSSLNRLLSLRERVWPSLSSQWWSLLQFRGFNQESLPWDQLQEVLWDGRRIYLFSLHEGFLKLPPDVRLKHGTVEKDVTVVIGDACLGGIVDRVLLHAFVGPDAMIMNWLVNIYGGRGLVYSLSEKEIFTLSGAEEFLASTSDISKFIKFKAGVLLTTLFVFFTITSYGCYALSIGLEMIDCIALLLNNPSLVVSQSLVSFTLRETQERMLRFTFLLQYHIRHRLPYHYLVLTHVAESLVFVPIMLGTLFFLIQFINDELLAFLVLSVVWICEVYSVICMRTMTCARFFPRLFFFYFTLFHVYFFSFPFGFNYLALATTILFLSHSMLLFWNNYEVPALRAGLVSASQPRMNGVMSMQHLATDPTPLVLPVTTRFQRSRIASAPSIFSVQDALYETGIQRTPLPAISRRRRLEPPDDHRNQQLCVECVPSLTSPLRSQHDEGEETLWESISSNLSHNQGEEEKEMMYEVQNSLSIHSGAESTNGSLSFRFRNRLDT